MGFSLTSALTACFTKSKANKQAKTLRCGCSCREPKLPLLHVEDSTTFRVSGRASLQLQGASAHTAGHSQAAAVPRIVCHLTCPTSLHLPGSSPAQPLAPSLTIPLPPSRCTTSSGAGKQEAPLEDSSAGWLVVHPVSANAAALTAWATDLAGVSLALCALVQQEPALLQVLSKVASSVAAPLEVSLLAPRSMTYECQGAAGSHQGAPGCRVNVSSSYIRGQRDGTLSPALILELEAGEPAAPWQTLSQLVRSPSQPVALAPTSSPTQGTGYAAGGRAALSTGCYAVDAGSSAAAKTGTSVVKLQSVASLDRGNGTGVSCTITEHPRVAAHMGQLPSPSSAPGVAAAASLQVMPSPVQDWHEVPAGQANSEDCLRPQAMLSAMPGIATLLELRLKPAGPPGGSGDAALKHGAAGEQKHASQGMAFGRVLLQNSQSLSYWGGLSSQADEGTQLIRSNLFRDQPDALAELETYVERLQQQSVGGGWLPDEQLAAGWSRTVQVPMTCLTASALHKQGTQQQGPLSSSSPTAPKAQTVHANSSPALSSELRDGEGEGHVLGRPAASSQQPCHVQALAHHLGQQPTPAAAAEALASPRPGASKPSWALRIVSASSTGAETTSPVSPGRLSSAFHGARAAEAISRSVPPDVIDAAGREGSQSAVTPSEEDSAQYSSSHRQKPMQVQRSLHRHTTSTLAIIDEAQGQWASTCSMDAVQPSMQLPASASWCSQRSATGTAAQTHVPDDSHASQAHLQPALRQALVNKAGPAALNSLGADSGLRSSWSQPQQLFVSTLELDVAEGRATGRALAGHAGLAMPMTRCSSAVALTALCGSRPSSSNGPTAQRLSGGLGADPLPGNVSSRALKLALLTDPAAAHAMPLLSASASPTPSANGLWTSTAPNSPHPKQHSFKLSRPQCGPQFGRSSVGAVLPYNAHPWHLDQQLSVPAAAGQQRWAGGSATLGAAAADSLHGHSCDMASELTLSDSGSEASELRFSLLQQQQPRQRDCSPGESAHKEGGPHCQAVLPRLQVALSPFYDPPALSVDPDRMTCGKADDVPEQAASLSENGAGVQVSARRQHGDIAGDEQMMRWHEVQVLPIRDPVTGKQAILLVQTDVTARVIMANRMASLSEMQLRVLETMFPRQVLEHAVSAGHSNDSLGSVAFHHDEISVLFMDIVGFTSMCKEVPPHTVMQYLNDLYSLLDDLCDAHSVYKVDTAGDCYIVAGALAKKDQDGFTALDWEADGKLGASNLVRFAQAALITARSMDMPNMQPTRVRIGLHTGLVVSGLLGTKLLKFSLFAIVATSIEDLLPSTGDTMNTSSRMESTCKPGCIHLSDTTFHLLEDEQKSLFNATGGIEVKGKGVMATFLHDPADHAAHAGTQDLFQVRQPLRPPVPPDWKSLHLPRAQQLPAAPGPGARGLVLDVSSGSLNQVADECSVEEGERVLQSTTGPLPKGLPNTGTSPWSQPQHSMPLKCVAPQAPPRLWWPGSLHNSVGGREGRADNGSSSRQAMLCMIQAAAGMLKTTQQPHL